MADTSPDTAAYLGDWMSRRAVALAPCTIAGYHHLIAQYIVPAIGTVPLEHLRAGDIIAILAAIAQSGHTRTAVAVYVLLRPAFARLEHSTP